MPKRMSRVSITAARYAMDRPRMWQELSAPGARLVSLGAAIGEQPQEKSVP
jgi:hypothetical protein